MSSKQLIKGTLILSSAGIITRVLGFFYRIYLSNAIGALNLGIYQLVFPVYGICHTIYVSGIQTSLSKKIAEISIYKKNSITALNYLVHALISSLIPALILSTIIYANAEHIANRLLFESRAGACLKLMSFVFPVCACTGCINGYYYGLKSTIIPAFSQLFEQISRITFIVIFSYAGFFNNFEGARIAVVGLIIGEICSCIFNIVSLSHLPFKRISFSLKYFTPIINPAIALTSNRLLVNILGTIESTLIPVMLKRYGLTTSQSLATFGTLTGMSIPFIMFPSTIAGSFSVMLLPEISQANAANQTEYIKKTTNNVISLSVVIGTISTAIFLFFGNDLGFLVFHSKDAGHFICILSWICPFLYISITFSSILNGLGKTITVLINSSIGLIMRILLLISLIPVCGLTGYLYALLISQIIITVLDLIAVIHTIHHHFHILRIFLVPVLPAFLITFPLKRLYIITINVLNIQSRIYSLVVLFLICFIITVVYLSIVFKGQISVLFRKVQ